MFSSYITSLGQQFIQKISVKISRFPENVKIHSCPQIVNVGYEAIFLARLDELFHEATVEKCLVEVSMSRGVPGIMTFFSSPGLGNWHQTLLVDTRIPRLVESADVDIEARILPDDLVGVLICVETVHEDQGNICLVFLVEILNLLYCQIQEC